MSTISTTQQATVALTVAQAQRIINKHHLDEKLTVSKLTEIHKYGYSFTAASKIYILDLRSDASPADSAATSSCFLTTSKLNTDSESGDAYHPNALAVIHALLSLVRAKTGIPISDSVLDVSQDILPVHYLLTPVSPFSSSDIVSLRKARDDGLLDASHSVMIDLQLGQYLGQLHTNVQNDWYGLPALVDPADPSYSWQETFTSLLETLLGRLSSAGYDHLPYQTIQHHMSRAIAFFLFDDVQVPSLIWLTGSADDIYLSLPSHPSTKTASIAAILPTVSHALWGDPLLETFFMSPPDPPSSALMEGYIASGGSPLTSIPRQKTKRIWYTIFLALIVLSESLLVTGPPTPELDEKKRWAEKAISECVDLLKDAPCY